MEHNEPWQIFADNGTPLGGRSASKDEFSHNRLIGMGASHVWIWRRRDGEVEILLQKRSVTKRTWPGLYDISAAGHIDADESPIDSALRETKEEIGLDIDAEKLYFIFSMRTPLDVREIDFVYLYELTEDVEFRFDDGEVESLKWISSQEFGEYIKDPDSNNLVPQGNEYFSLLTNNLARISTTWDKKTYRLI
jgi:8-oxo-dGTP pyrophosphatase MutT (NUDIX family)